MPAKATLSCPDGCFELTYRASIDSDSIDDQDFLNQMGPPQQVQMSGNACPNCGSNVAVDWGDG